ncbi:MAG: hypothetical protein RR248_00440 [Clostridia bacterium]
MKYKTYKTTNKKGLLISLIVIASILALTAITFLIISLVDDGDSGTGGNKIDISGVVTFNGAGLPGVKVKYGTMEVDVTDSQGQYAINLYEAATITYEKFGFNFNPSSVFVNKKGQKQDVVATLGEQAINTITVRFVDETNAPINIDVDFTVGDKTYKYTAGNSYGLTVTASIGDKIEILPNDYVEGASQTILDNNKTLYTTTLTYKQTELTIRMVDLNGNNLKGLDIYVDAVKIAETDNKGSVKLQIPKDQVIISVKDSSGNFEFDSYYAINKLDNNRVIKGRYIAKKSTAVEYTFVDNSGKPIAGDVYVYIGIGMCQGQPASSQKVGNFYKIVVKDKLSIPSLQKQYFEQGQYITAYAVVGDVGYTFKIYNSCISGMIVAVESQVFKGTINDPTKANSLNVYVSKQGYAYECEYDLQGLGSFCVAIPKNDALFIDDFLLTKVGDSYKVANIWEEVKQGELHLYVAKKAVYNVIFKFEDGSFINESDTSSIGKYVKFINKDGQLFKASITFTTGEMPEQNTTITLYEGANTEFDVSIYLDESMGQDGYYKVSSVIVDSATKTITIVVAPKQ